MPKQSKEIPRFTNEDEDASFGPPMIRLSILTGMRRTWLYFLS